MKGVKRRRRRVVVLILVAAALGGAAIAGGVFSNGVKADDVNTRMQKLSESVVRAWLPLQRSGGAMRLNSPRLQRPSRNTAYFGSAALSVSLRISDSSDKQKTVDAGVKAVNYAIVSSKLGSPFTILAVAMAYKTASKHLRDYPAVRQALPVWAVWLNKQSPNDKPLNHACYASAECYNNWDLVMALAAIEMRRANVSGTPAPGSYLADRRGTNTWLRRLFSEDIPKSIGPQPQTDWPLGRSGVLSDPPTNPSAYHQLSSALLASATREAPLLFSRRALSAAKRVSRYSKALIAPTGDVALYGRSQMQSWTLAAALLTAANSVDSYKDDTWPTFAKRLIDRLSSPDYRDSSGVFAITPSTRDKSLSGVDLYAAPADYNGLTLMLLEMAIRLWPENRGTSELPTDRTGNFADLNGSHIVIGRQPDLWWQWGTRKTKTDLRYDAGLIQVQSRVDGVWKPLLAARPVTQFDRVIGPALMLKGLPARFAVSSVRVTPNGQVLTGEFVTDAGAGHVRSEVTLEARGNKLVISWPVKAGQVYSGAVPLVQSRAAQSSLINSTTRVTFSPNAQFPFSLNAPSATSIRTRLRIWQMKIDRDQVASISIAPNPGS